MTTNKEAIIFSGALSPEGRNMAKRLMKENGLSIERLFNLLAELETDVQSIGDKVFDLEYELNSHISSHD